ncbi:hypothetical protein KV100_10115 [Mumia sp. zg.B21]|uniref:hypothetical protein n=1 Tax=Mumia sp. zg.B21 TaxID=2855447 RepID=UPI001C6F3442|nr:hypothetical protein [Mumia sp. zg.B21]MBW9210015.1 hypothetical protein [Mumia sp. zg.B21]
MTRRWMRIGAVIAGTVLAVGLVPGAAQAATSDVKDRRGDAPRAADITKLRVKNGATRVTGIITLRRGNKRKMNVAELRIKTRDSGRWAYLVSIVRNRQGKVTARRLGWRRGNDPTTYRSLRCAGITTAWKGRRTSISVPVRCLSRTSRTRVKVKAGTLVYTGWDHIIFDDLSRYSRDVRRG